MASNVITIQCEFCHEGFNEDTRCPRNLDCKHTLCTYCVNVLIKNNITVCPTCKQDFKAKNASDLGINTACLENVRSLINEEPPSKRVRLQGNWLLNPEFSQRQQQVKELMKEIALIQQTIETDNERIRKVIFQDLMDVISQNNNAFGKLENIREKLEKFFNEQDTQYARMVARHEYLDGTQEEYSSFVELFKNFEKIFSEEKTSVETWRKEVQNVREKTEIILDVLEGRERRQADTFPVPGTSRMGLLEESTNNSGTENRVPYVEIKRLVKEGRVFAVQELEERHRYAKISCTENGHVFLHHLNEDPPPRKSYLIPHCALMGVIDSKNIKLFIQLASGPTRRILGNLIIRLSSISSPRAKNFTFLCTGEKGVSYANSRVLGVAHKGTNIEFAHFGDYQQNTGEGGHSLIECTGPVYIGLLTKMLRAGMVTGWVEGFGGETTASQFKIYTCNSSRPLTDPDLGMVEEGLSVLTDAISSHQDIGDVVINDCGIILPDVVSHM